MKCIREGICDVWCKTYQWWRVVFWTIDDLSSAVFWNVYEWLTPDSEFDSEDFYSEDFDPEDHQ